MGGPGQGQGVVRSSRTPTKAGLTQSGEEPGWYAGPTGSRARRHVWWSLRTLGITSNDDSVMPTGVKDELVPGPLGEEQGPGSVGMPRGPSPGPPVSVDAWG